MASNDKDNQINSSNFLFDLNAPLSSDSSNHEMSGIFLNEISSNQSDLQPAPLLIDLNMEPNQELDSSILELDVDQSVEDEVFIPNTDIMCWMEVKEHNLKLCDFTLTWRTSTRRYSSYRGISEQPRDRRSCSFCRRRTQQKTECTTGI
ncbi:hypothetical protein CASFOL_037986 [Castilleja foliolosa]|uniref:Uncharacterized protein n=1 Tax=Castilleja foliolosa TaxID=1961234 RepID=A0ABD3BLQ3_9LAMI